MSEPAKDPAIADLERRLDEATSQLGDLTEQLARVEPLLRALLKRAPKRHETPAAPRSRGGKLTDEQLADIRRRVGAPKRRRRQA